MVLYTSATISLGIHVIAWDLQIAKAQMPARRSHMQWQVAQTYSKPPFPPP